MAALFGNRSFMSGLRDPRTDEEKAAELARLLAFPAGGMSPTGIGPRMYGQGGLMGSASHLTASDDPMGDSAVPADKYDPAGGVSVTDSQPRSAPPGVPAMGSGGNQPSIFRPALPDFGPGSIRSNVPANAPRLPQQDIAGTGNMDPQLAAIVGNAPTKPKRNLLRDLAAGGLAVLGDALSESNNPYGRRGGYSAVDALTKQWASRRETYKDEVKNYELRKRLAGMPGMTARELQAFAIDPKAWAGSMAKDATSRFGAATLNPGDQRYLGDGNGAYQAPTRGELYARSIGAMPGSEAWNEAIQDQELGSNGPTAFGNTQAIDRARAAQAQALERLRQSGRMTLQGARTAGQQTVRGTPTYRDLNPPPPRSRSGAAPRLDDIPTIRTPEEARKLPPGTQFKTPDGRIKVR